MSFKSSTSWVTYSYKPVPNYPGYGVDLEGHILSFWGADHKISRRLPRLLNGNSNWQTKKLRFRIRHRSGAIHRHPQTHLILMAFVGPRPKGADARHKSGPSNSPDNLMWVKRESPKAR